MSSRLISAYTPSNTDPKVLKRIFVQREKLLERIVDRLSASMKSGDKHHILLVGPRGSGKTHLVSLAAWELQQKNDLADVMRIAWLGEDDTFSGLIHLAFGIAQALATEYPDEFPQDFKSDVRGLPVDDAAISVLNTVIRNLKHRHLLVITENLDQTFSGLGDSGQKKLRAFLQETRRIATLATSQQLFNAVSSRKEAFFGFFDTRHLSPLSVEDAQQLIGKIAREHRDLELEQFLGSPDARYRLRALHHLAGGNHRMYVLLAEFLTREALDDLVSAFEKLAEDMTPYFQERIRSLPDQQRQLVQCLCEAGGAITVKEIAAETFIAEGNCSKQLGNLKSKGYVRSEKRGKESYYDMAEPLMRLCLEVKNQRGRPLRLVARFLKAWFPMGLLDQSISKLERSSRAAEYCEAALLIDQSFEKSINESLAEEIREKLVVGDYKQAKELTDELATSDQAEGLYLRAYAASLQNNLPGELLALDQIIEMQGASENQKAGAFLMRARLHGQQGKKELELAGYSSVIELQEASAKHKAIAFFNRGVLYNQRGKIKLELADYKSVLELDGLTEKLKARAYFYCGITYSQLGNIELEIAQYTFVIEMPEVSACQKAESRVNRGWAYGKQGEAEKALADFSLVIAMPDAPPEQTACAYVNRGRIHNRNGKSELAIADYTSVIEMPEAPADQKVSALLYRGIVNGQRDEVDLELADFKMAIEMPNVATEQKAVAFLALGANRWRNKDWKSSFECYEQGLALNAFSNELRTAVLFSIAEPMVATHRLSDVLAAITRAFEEGDKESELYGGTPGDLLSMVLRRATSEWADYIAAITPLFVQHGVADKLGQGVTRSIQSLDEGDFSASQLDVWDNAWQAADRDCEALQIPLDCLNSAVEVIKSNPKTDRPLFRLPLEIRQLIRPLLNRSLGPSENQK